MPDSALPLSEVTGADPARALVARTCALQGVPEHVSDAETLHRVAAILVARRGNAGPEAGATLITSTTTALTTGRGRSDPR